MRATSRSGFRVLQARFYAPLRSAGDPAPSHSGIDRALPDSGAPRYGAARPPTPSRGLGWGVSASRTLPDRNSSTPAMDGARPCPTSTPSKALWVEWLRRRGSGCQVKVTASPPIKSPLPCGRPNRARKGPSRLIATGPSTSERYKDSESLTVIPFILKLAMLSFQPKPR